MKSGFRSKQDISCRRFVAMTLVHLQLDAQNSYLFTYNTFIKITYMFRALPCSSSGGLRRWYICIACLALQILMFG